MNGWEPACVRCYSGYTYAQEPRSFAWRGRSRRVARIDRSWHTPEGRRFLVVDEDGSPFLLEYRAGADCWLAKSLGQSEPGSS